MAEELSKVVLTPWQADKDNIVGITKSSVDQQDELSMEDYLDNPSLANQDSWYSPLAKSGLQLLSQTYYGQAIKLAGNFEEKDSIRPSNTVEYSDDLLGIEVKKIKESKYKNVKLTSKLGQYNSVMNLLGTASGMYVGTLGKGATEALDDGLSMALQSLPFSSLATNAATIIKRFGETAVDKLEGNSTISSVTPSWEDLIALTAANYYTILTYKPGLTIRSYGKTLEYITGKNGSYPLENSKNKEKRENASKLYTETSQETRTNKIITVDRANYSQDVTNKSGTEEWVTGQPRELSLKDYTPKDKEDLAPTVDGYSEVDDVEVIHPKENLEYVTGAFSNNDAIETPEKNDEELSSPNIIPDRETIEVNDNRKEFLSGLVEKDGEVYSNYVEYITNENVGKTDEDIGLISKENLEAFMNNYGMLEDKGDDAKDSIRYTTGVTLTGKGVIKSKNKVYSQLNSDTVIDSSLRKELYVTTHQRGKENSEITDYDLDESVFLDGEEINDDGVAKKYTRVTKAKVFNRVNNVYREIGGLYIEPFYSGEALKAFEIPFEFNPNISEGSSTAKYAEESLLGRILPIRSYIGSDAGKVSIETRYLAVNDGSTSNRKQADGWKNGWMMDWTPEKLRKIERQYRALVLPYISGANFVRPPIVRIKLRSASANTANRIATEKANDQVGTSAASLTVGDLFRYPSLGNGIQITQRFDGRTMDKRYVVTDVTISPLESWGTSYKYDIQGIFSDDENGSFYNGVGRYGFKVTISMSETTKNFLDLIPNYGQYVKASDSDESENQYTGANYKFTQPEKIDLTTCLYDGMNMNIDPNYINTYAGGVANKKEKEFGTIMYYRQTTESEVEEDDTDPLLLPESSENKEKKFYDYLKELKTLITTKEIMELLVPSTWINNKKFCIWLFGKETSNSILKDFDNDWSSYSDVMLQLGFSYDGLIKEIFDGSKWQATDGFKQWVCTQDKVEYCYKAGVQFKQYLKIFNSIGENNPENIIKCFKDSPYDSAENDYGYINWLTSYKELGTKSLVENWSELYSILSSAGYSNDDIDCLFKKGNWGSESALSATKDEDSYYYWIINKPEILLRRMDFDKWIDFVKGNSLAFENGIEQSLSSETGENEISVYTDIISKVAKTWIVGNEKLLAGYRKWLAALSTDKNFKFVYDSETILSEETTEEKTSILDKISDTVNSVSEKALSILNSETEVSDDNENAANLYEILKKAGYSDGEIITLLKMEDESGWTKNEEFKELMADSSAEDIEASEDSYEGYQVYESKDTTEDYEDETGSDEDIEDSDYFVNNWTEGFEQNIFLAIFKKSKDDGFDFDKIKDNA